MTTNLLVYAGLNSNSLERALRLNVPEHSTTIKIAKLGQKHIMSLLSGKTRKKTQEIHQAIESESDVISHNTRAALYWPRDNYFIIKL